MLHPVNAGTTKLRSLASVQPLWLLLPNAIKDKCTYSSTEQFRYDTLYFADNLYCVSAALEGVIPEKFCVEDKNNALSTIRMYCKVTLALDATGVTSSPSQLLGVH